MDNDKVFVAYALTLVAGAAAVLTFATTMEGATLPPPAMFVEHLLMGLAVRAAYKSFGGFDWSDWSLSGSGPVREEADLEPANDAAWTARATG